MRALVALSLALFVLVASADAHAQTPAGRPRIGALAATHQSIPGFVDTVLGHGLSLLGYSEGRNIAFERRSAAGSDDRLPALAVELVHLKVDVILAEGVAAVRAAQQATRMIPIVMGLAGDPVESGIVSTLARPGGNVTGVTAIAPELAGKRLELLKEVVPKVSRVAVLWNATSSETTAELRATEAAARALGLRLQILEVRVFGDVETALAAAVKEGAGALAMLADPLTASYSARIAGLATTRRLATISPRFSLQDHTWLISYGPNVLDLGRRAAVLVDRVLRGARPGDLPVERPTKFDLAINLKTARALGLTIPRSVLERADQVIDR